MSIGTARQTTFRRYGGTDLEDISLRDRSVVFFLLLAIILFASPWSASAMEPENFRYMTKLKGEIRKDALYRVVLPAEILRQCERACKDIRIFDRNNREIPFVILENFIPATGNNHYPLEVVAYDDASEKTIITLKRNDTLAPVTEIDMKIPLADYYKAVTILGRNDSDDWKVLGFEPIYDFTSRVPLQKTTVAFEKNSYRYLQVIIDEGKSAENSQHIRFQFDGFDFTAPQYTKKRLKIEQFTAVFAGESAEKAVYNGVTISPAPAPSEDGKRTELYFESHLPVTTIEFAISTPFYYRPVRIYSSVNGRKESYSLLAEGALFSFPSSNRVETRRTINIPRNQDYRFYHIEIENGASPPLAIDSLTLRWIQKQIFFVGLDNDQAYRLCYGSPVIADASYDISRLFPSGNWFHEQWETLSMLPIVTNANYKPYRDKRPGSGLKMGILIAVGILVVLVIGFFLFQLWKKTR